MHETDKTSSLATSFCHSQASLSFKISKAKIKIFFFCFPLPNWPKKLAPTWKFFSHVNYFYFPFLKSKLCLLKSFSHYLVIHAIIFQGISGILSQNFRDFHPLSGTPTVTSVSVCFVHKCHKNACNFPEWTLFTCLLQMSFDFLREVITGNTRLFAYLAIITIIVLSHIF